MSDNFRDAAIMRGAVLYKLGMDFVKDRVMRVSYGTAANVTFQEGYHPTSRRVISFDGSHKCRGVMHWFAKKVQNSHRRSAEHLGRYNCERYSL
jgi:hypothetical protein